VPAAVPVDARLVAVALLVEVDVGPTVPGADAVDVGPTVPGADAVDVGPTVPGADAVDVGPTVPGADAVDVGPPGPPVPVGVGEPGGVGGVVGEPGVVGVAVVVAEGDVLGGGVGAAQTGAVIVLVSRVTVPLRASSRPRITALFATVIDVSARMLPTKTELVWSVAEAPIFQNTLHAWAPLMSRTTLLVAAVIDDPAWKTNTESGSFWPLRTSVPVRSNVDWRCRRRLSGSCHRAAHPPPPAPASRLPPGCKRSRDPPWHPW